MTYSKGDCVLKKEKLIILLLVMSVIFNIVLVTGVKIKQAQDTDKAWLLLAEAAFYVNNIGIDELDEDVYRLRYNNMIKKLYASSEMFLNSKKNIEQDIGFALNQLVVAMEYPEREAEVVMYSKEIYAIVSDLGKNTTSVTEAIQNLNRIVITLFDENK